MKEHDARPRARDPPAATCRRSARDCPNLLQMLDLNSAVRASYLGSAASVPVCRHVPDLHRPHLSRFADVPQQVFHRRGVLGMDPRGCQPGAFEREAA
jgi:hypothetical protein